MSKINQTDVIKRIPLEHNDRIRSSTKNWIKINVEIKINSKFSNLFEISGEFPTYISKINSNERLKSVDIKVGDNIISINDQNVSRASVKSVLKILKSSNVIKMTLCRPDQDSLNRLLNSNSKVVQNKQTLNKLNTLLNLFKSNIKSTISKEPKTFVSSCIGNEQNKEQLNNNKNIIVQEYMLQTKVFQSEKSDCGYYSIPSVRTNTASIFSSSSDLESIKSDSQCSNDISHQIEDYRNEINEFLNIIQKAIDHYVRPTIMFKILTIDESLVLYQNIEKLIPVTKFLFNIINSNDNSNKSPNAESLKIVFDSFKIYLNGLPNSINLLGELTYSNNEFIKFVESLDEIVSFKIMDFLFMPLRFVQNTIDFLKIFHNTSDQLNQVIDNLYDCVSRTCLILEDKFETEFIPEIEEINSITTVSDCSDFYSLKNETQSTDSEAIRVMIKNDNKSEQWTDACLYLDKQKIESYKQVIDLSLVRNIKKSQNANVIFIQILNSDLDQLFYAIKFDNEANKNIIYEILQKQIN